MTFVSRVLAWIRGLFSPPQVLAPVPGQAPEHAPQFVAPVHFSSAVIIDKPLHNDEIATEYFYCVKIADKPKWALFKCPCRCGDVVTLSLQPIHRPHWRLTSTLAGRPTLYPSIWRDKGCLSHFWLRDGRVFWCTDTGIHPDLQASH